MLDPQQELSVLEKCLQECKRRLNVCREVGDDLQASLLEADMDAMLDRLQPIYQRLRVERIARKHA